MWATICDINVIVTKCKRDFLFSTVRFNLVFYFTISLIDVYTKVGRSH